VRCAVCARGAAKGRAQRDVRDPDLDSAGGALSTLSALTMLVKDKTKNIPVLRTMGAVT
jgi:hypothetical protein